MTVPVTNTHYSIKSNTQEKSKPQKKHSEGEKPARASRNMVEASIRGDLTIALSNRNVSPREIKPERESPSPSCRGEMLPPGRAETPQQNPLARKRGERSGEGKQREEREGANQASSLWKARLRSSILAQWEMGTVPANERPGIMREKKTILGFVICTQGFSLLNARC